MLRGAGKDLRWLGPFADGLRDAWDVPRAGLPEHGGRRPRSLCAPRPVEPSIDGGLVTVQKLTSSAVDDDAEAFTT